MNYNFFKKFMCANIPIAMAKRKLIPPNSLINFNGITQILDNIWKMNKHAKILKTLTHEQASTIKNLRKKLSKSLKSKQWKNKAISLLEEAFPATIVLTETIIKINNKLDGPKRGSTVQAQIGPIITVAQGEICADRWANCATSATRAGGPRCDHRNSSRLIKCRRTRRVWS